MAHNPPPQVADTVYRLGRRIRSAREERGWTQQQFADRLGVNRATVVQVERGKLGSSIATYACALYALGMLDRFELLIDPKRDP